MLNLASILKDVECFAGLAGARNVQLSSDSLAITYHKRDLHNYDTPVTVQVRTRKHKRSGPSFVVVTSWIDVNGRERQVKSAPQYSESALYHEISRQCHSIIA